MNLTAKSLVLVPGLTAWPFNLVLGRENIHQDLERNPVTLSGDTGFHATGGDTTTTLLREMAPRLTHFLVPPNTRATICLPKFSKGNVIVKESGKALWPAQPQIKDPGVLVVSDEDPCIKCLVGSGDYKFTEMPSNSK